MTGLKTEKGNDCSVARLKYLNRNRFLLLMLKDRFKWNIFLPNIVLLNLHRYSYSYQHSYVIFNYFWIFYIVASLARLSVLLICMTLKRYLKGVSNNRRTMTQYGLQFLKTMCPVPGIWSVQQYRELGSFHGN